MNRRQSRTLAYDTYAPMDAARVMLQGNPSWEALDRLERQAAKASRVLSEATDLHPKDRQRVARAHQDALDCIQDCHRLASIELTDLELGLLRALNHPPQSSHELRDITRRVHAEGVTDYTLDDLYAARQTLTRARLAQDFPPPPYFGLITQNGHMRAALDPKDRGPVVSSVVAR